MIGNIPKLTVGFPAVIVLFTVRERYGIDEKMIVDMASVNVRTNNYLKKLLSASS